ncbi:hypothetical protein EO087_01810 [Dyella sp. M7H15-1]|uniref:Rz1-like lysis system protein LysC n=1 Tax=Dyella sp. M7H15-1 TaxID=2501295 RepID=UPI0010050A0E|nr:hypothetical protein [Dyella sp. M7H15-1]QAU22879.1 hypothetical protein EO087_01810 [Dyella sp. M7H15-1]
MSRRLQGLIAFVLLATGCTRNVQLPTPAVVPKVVTRNVTQFVPVPAALTAPCHKTPRRSNSVLDVVDAYNARGDDIDECNARMQAIRDLGALP